MKDTKICDCNCLNIEEQTSQTNVISAIAAYVSSMHKIMWDEV